MVEVVGFGGEVGYVVFCCVCKSLWAVRAEPVLGVVVGLGEEGLEGVDWSLGRHGFVHFWRDCRRG